MGALRRTSLSEGKLGSAEETCVRQLEECTCTVGGRRQGQRRAGGGQARRAFHDRRVWDVSVVNGG